MRIRVRCYGNVRQALDTDSLELSIGGEVTVADVLDRLSAETVDFETLRASQGIVVMRDGNHLEAESPVANGDVLRLSTSPMPE